MYLTEKEIFSQYDALKKTYDYMISKADEIKEFMKDHSSRTLTYIGAGSGYCLCQSSEMSAKVRLGIPSSSFAAGDLMINFPHYGKVIKNTILIAPSRSGSTSEVVMSVKRAKEEYGTPCIAIAAVKGSELSKIADLNVEIPWAFDESVCQTRTVSNLYTANLMLLGIVAEDKELLEEIGQAIKNGEEFIKKNLEQLKNISMENEWEKVVVLADSELQGIAAEGAIAFMEIPQVNSNYNHVLDVRHGPAVMINEKTLVIMATGQYGQSYQKDLIKDLKVRGSIVVTVGSEVENVWGSDFNITIHNYKNYSVSGIPFINVPQIIAYYKALRKGINPDVPNGLDPWIKL